jgi:putative ABC transport system permease protein
LHVPGQQPVDFGAASEPLGAVMVAEVPGTVEQTHIVSKDVTVDVAHRQYMESINAVDKNFFTIIKLPLRTGDPATVLARPDGVVLSETTARSYFGTADAVGRTLLFDEKRPYTVTGILRDLPYNTQFAGGIFVQIEPPLPKRAAAPVSPKASQSEANGGEQTQQTDYDPEGWTKSDASTYIRLAPGINPHAIEREIPKVFARHLSPAFKAAISSFAHMPIEQFVTAKLVPLPDVHLTPRISGAGMKAPGSKVSVYGMIAIAILILIVACCNFTNLATACAAIRAKEVGLRKVLGAVRKQILVQFTFESVLAAFVALVFSLAAVEILLPFYSAFLGRNMSFDYLGNLRFSLIVVAIAGLAGLCGGFYPALVMSGFRPVQVLRPVALGQTGRGPLRTVLVVMQFAISIGLGIAAAVVFSQTNYARHIDLGIDDRNIIAVSTYQTNLDARSRENFMREIAAAPDVEAAALSQRVPGSDSMNLDFATLPGSLQRVSVQVIGISPEFPSVYGMKLAAGRMLSRSHGADAVKGGFNLGSGNVVIDENAARAFGFTPQSAIGKHLNMVGGQVTIVGVARNVLFNGARSIQVAPAIYSFNDRNTSTLSVRLKAGRISEGLAGIDRTWHRFVPDKPILRWFVDDSMNRLYAEDEKQGVLLTVFVAVAILIAALGLFGLAAFTVERRTKEIGLRKVFGAETGDIVRLLLWQFSIPVLIANLIAWPVAYYYLRHWLDGYAYRIALGPFYFVAAGFVALLIAWATVIAHAVHVARANPVNALRYE